MAVVLPFLFLYEEEICTAWRVAETAILCEVLTTLELFSVSGPQSHGSIENPTVGSSSYLETGGFSSFLLCQA